MYRYTLYNNYMCKIRILQYIIPILSNHTMYSLYIGVFDGVHCKDMLYGVHCTVYNVHYSIYKVNSKCVRCTIVYNGYFKVVYILYACTWYNTKQITLLVIHHLYTIQCTLYSVHCTLSLYRVIVYSVE